MPPLLDGKWYLLTWLGEALLQGCECVCVCVWGGGTLNQVYTGRLFHCYMSDESICYFRGVRSILLLFYFWWKIL